MKRVTLMATLILVVAIFCFYLSSHAIEVSPTKPLQPSQPSIQPSPKPPQIILLPDLIVEKVWLDSQNRIAFLVRNNGNGLIPEDVHGKANFKITYGDRHKEYPLKVLDPKKALTKPGGMVSFTSDIELSSTGKVTVEVDSTRQIQESREDNNLLSAILIPRMAISPEPRPVKPSFEDAKIKKPSETKPPEAVSKGEPIIKTSRIYQKGGKIHILFKNEGLGRISERDYQQGKLVLRYGDKSQIFLLKDVDPAHRLDTPGAELEFNTNIPLETKPGAGSLPVNITFFDLKDMKIAPIEMAIPLFPQLEVAKPDFAWTTIETAGSVKPALINKGGRFVGGLDYKISVLEISKLYEHRQLVFKEENPFDHGEVVPVPLYYIFNHIDWRQYCSLRLLCEVKSQYQPESDETNNIAIITIYPPPSHARFELMNEWIELGSGQALWYKGDGDIVRIRDNVSVAKPDVLLVDIRFEVFNCSGETRTLNPLISYLGPGGQKREQNIGPVQIRPGGHVPFQTTIQLGIRLGNYERDNFIHINLWENKFIRVKIDFTSDESFRAMLRGQCLGSLYYPESVELGFRGGKKILKNGGTVTLQKGDWLKIYRNEYAIDFHVYCKFKACKDLRTSLIFKLESFGNEFTWESPNYNFRAGTQLELMPTAKMCPSPRPWTPVLKIIDKQTGNEIFLGVINCSDSLLNEVGWRPWLHLSSGPYVYLDKQKKEVTIKCFVLNSGGPAKNQKWWLSVYVKKQNILVHSKTWEFNGAGEAEHIERSFTFKPTYDEDHTYKVSLSASNDNILTIKQADLERRGSFYVPW